MCRDTAGPQRPRAMSVDTEEAKSGERFFFRKAKRSSRTWEGLAQLAVTDESDSRDLRFMLTGSTKRIRAEWKEWLGLKWRTSSGAVFDEDAGWRLSWDVATVALAAVVMLLEPFVAAFKPRGLTMGVGEYESQDMWVLVLDVLNLAWFSIDIVLTFFTTYSTNHGVKIWQPTKIAARYLRGFFVWDVVCTFPWERAIAKRVCRQRGCSKSGGKITILKLIAVVRSIRGSKIHLAPVLARKFACNPSDWGFPPYWDPLLHFVLGAFFMNHVVACVWFVIGRNNMKEKHNEACFLGFPYDDRHKLATCTWYQLNGYADAPVSRAFLYITCLYWAVTTVTTVGYGDLTANTIAEKLFVLLVEVAGVALFASFVSALSSDVITDSAAEEQRKKEAALKRYMYRHRFPPPLAASVTAYINKQYEVERIYGDDPEIAGLLKRTLNVPLKRAVALHFAARDACIRHNLAFKSQNYKFMADCIVVMKADVAAPFELVVPKMSAAKALHLVTAGGVAAGNGAANRFEPLLSVDAGDYFGEEALLLNVIWTEPLYSKDWTEFSVISFDDLDRILEAHPSVDLREHAERRVAEAPDVLCVGEDVLVKADPSSSSDAALKAPLDEERTTGCSPPPREPRRSDVALEEKLQSLTRKIEEIHERLVVET